MSVIIDEKNDAVGANEAMLPEKEDTFTAEEGMTTETDAPQENTSGYVIGEEMPEEPAAHDRCTSEIIMEDLEQLISEFPELSDLRDASELSDPIRYGKLRDLGLSPKEAYLATAGRKKIIDTRAHLSGARPKPLNAPSSIPAYAVRCVRELFDGISDEEIISLYRRVNG